MQLLKSACEKAGRFLLAGMVLLASCDNASKKEENRHTNGQPPKTDAVYTLGQQVFCMNILSNISAHFDGADSVTINNRTVSAVDSVLKDNGVRTYIGRWQRVWGPVVYTTHLPLEKKKAKASNTLFIVQNEDNPSLFVVAIAGTNPASWFDWKQEDLKVGTMLKWPYRNDANYPTDSISQATNDGLNVLLALQGGEAQKAAAYLQAQAKSITQKNNGKMTVWVAGHSLGGALAPAYALYLQDVKNSTWGNPNNINIYCQAVAGATPGNKNFSDYYTSRLGSNTMRVWNTRDVVPHGFDTAMMREVGTLYADTGIKTPDAVTFLDNRVYIPKVKNKGYTQLFPQQAGFTSYYYNDNNRIDTNTKKKGDLFTMNALCMHIPAYAQYFGVQEFQKGVARICNMQYPFFTEGFSAAPIKDSATYPNMNM